VIIVTYNHKQYIYDCITSVLKNNPLEVIVVDNSSTDGTTDFVEKKIPEVIVIRNSKNLGYGGGNNLGVERAKGEYIVILNPDTIVEDGWLEELLKPLEEKDDLISTPKVVRSDGSAVWGNIEHFTGLTFARDLNENSEKFEYLNGFSGSCFAIKREDYLKLGGFDENFFIYMDDAEFSWRLHTKGFKILYIPTSIIHHHHTLKVPPEKLYHLEKGRYMILRKYLSAKWYFFLIPSLLMTEILTCGYSLLNGSEGIKFKFKAVKDGLNINIKKIDCNERKLLKSLDWKIPEDQLTYNIFDKTFKKIANAIYWINYKVIKK
jgi:GT2 family glycosyltransferase